MKRATRLIPNRAKGNPGRYPRSQLCLFPGKPDAFLLYLFDRSYLDADPLLASAFYQTYSYSRHFVSTCIRVCGYESTSLGIDANGQVTAVGYCPIGVDVDRVIADRCVEVDLPVLSLPLGR